MSATRASCEIVKSHESPAQPSLDFMIPRFRILAARKYDEPDPPGEGTPPDTGAVIVVGRVPSPGVSPISRGIRMSDAVKRNTNRFPPDVGFQLTEEELAEIRSQPVIASMRSQSVTGSRTNATAREDLRSQIVTLKRGQHGLARCHDTRATPADVAQTALSAVSPTASRLGLPTPDGASAGANLLHNPRAVETTAHFIRASVKRRAGFVENQVLSAVNIFRSFCLARLKAPLESGHLVSANPEGCQPVAGASLRGRGVNDHRMRGFEAGTLEGCQSSCRATRRLETANEFWHPSRMRFLFYRTSGGIARGLAQPPATGWQPSGLLPSCSLAKNVRTLAGLKVRHVIAWAGASRTSEGPGRLPPRSPKPCRGDTTHFAESHRPEKAVRSNPKAPRHT